MDEFYADWDIEKETGLLIGTLNKAVQEEELAWPQGISEKRFNEKISEASYKVEKISGTFETHWLSNRMVLVKRTKILVELEKELIKNGLEEELRIAKRPLERRVIEAAQLETVLDRKISKIFSTGMLIPMKAAWFSSWNHRNRKTISSLSKLLKEEEVAFLFTHSSAFRNKPFEKNGSPETG